jgi:TolB-like protein/DNA-binding winged helix-turn-helix (wHTH) protein/Flp pilus assembly protein TadD
MNAEPPVPVLEFGDFRLDMEEHHLVRGDGTTVSLTPRVFETLRYLIDHSGRVVTKESIMDAVWPDCIVEENNLAKNISTLRRIFGDTPASQRYIATVPGRGYRFIPEVRSSPNGAVAQVRNWPAESAVRKPRFSLLFAAAVTLLVLSAALVLFWRNGAPRAIATPAGPVPEKSIAVLPFANLSGDPENAYFADGMKDEILTRLSKIVALKVISGTSTQKFKSNPNNVGEIARELGVANILQGSVQKSAETVRVTVQLIHAQTDTHLWAETYDRKLTDMFQVETEVAQRITTALAAKLTGLEERALKAKPTANFEAHQAYLKGRYFWSKRTIDGHKRAVEYLKRAIAIDPTYAQAYAGLADAYLFLADEGVPAQKETLNSARAALKKALELDDTLADAHASLGLLAMNDDWDWSEAEREFKRAIELNPNYATAHQWTGEFFAYMGRFDEGITEIKRAYELDPLSLIISTDVAKVYALARRYDEAIEQYKRALEIDPEFTEAHALLAMTYSMKGMPEEAIGELRKVKNIQDNPAYLSWLGYVYGVAGRKDEAQKVVKQLTDLSSQTYVSPFWMALVHTGLGERDQAFQWFERVFAERAKAGAVSLKVNPIFDSLRSDPRFADLLRRANFAP